MARIRFSGNKPKNVKVEVESKTGKFVDISHLVRNYSIHGGIDIKGPHVHVVILELVADRVQLPEDVEAEVNVIPKVDKTAKLKEGRPGRTKSGLYTID